MQTKKRPSLDEILGRTWWTKFLEAAYDWYLLHLAEPYCRRFGHSTDIDVKFSGDYCNRCRRMIVDRRPLKLPVRWK